MKWEFLFNQPADFIYPADSNWDGTSMYDGNAIIGDSNNNSIKIFAESSINSITLPADMDFIPEAMFCNSPYLTSIKYMGQAYDGTNVLNSVNRIGAHAFSSCIGLSNLTIPSSVVVVGESAFFDWGKGTNDQGEQNNQTINIDFYEGYLPNGWADNWYWFEGNSSNVTISYKALTEIEIDWQDDRETKQVIGVKPALEMPSIELPENKGYEFKGIYSEKEGKGFQYYSNDLQVKKCWSEGDPNPIYAYWGVETYEIIYPDELNGHTGTNQKTYTVKDSIEISPIEYDGYVYTFTPNRIEKGTTGNITLTPAKDLKEYKINYEVDLKGNTNPNPSTYNKMQEVVFENLSCEGYSFSWSPSSIPLGTMQDGLVVTGTWTPNQYAIKYNVNSGTQHDNPVTYTYGQELVLSPATCGGYFVTWDKTTISAGTIGEVTINAVYTEKSLAECYNNGVYEIWTFNQLNEIRYQPNGGNGRTYRLMGYISPQYSYQTVYWTPISEFRGTFDGNGHFITGYKLDVSSGGNLGFCRINYGTIINLELGLGFDVRNDLSNVNVGAFAGINRGMVSNCIVLTPFNRPFFECYATGDSYMGCYVGVNEGTIDNCDGGDVLKGSCNMGTIAGKNSGTIKNCNAGNSIMQIWFDYRDYNACIGGIVGLQTGGNVTNCSYYGEIYWSPNYNSSNYTSWSEDREMQPCIGIMIGFKQGGTISGSSWTATTSYKDIVVSAIPPNVVTWTTGMLWWEETHTHDQGLYFKNAECGRIA